MSDDSWDFKMMGLIDKLDLLSIKEMYRRLKKMNGTYEFDDDYSFMEIENIKQWCYTNVCGEVTSVKTHDDEGVYSVSIYNIDSRTEANLAKFEFEFRKVYK